MDINIPNIALKIALGICIIPPILMFLAYLILPECPDTLWEMCFGYGQ